MLTSNLNLQDVIKRTIHHEIGHWLMARHLEFDVDGIKIGMNKHNQIFGMATVHPVPKSKFSSVDEVYDHLLKRITVLCAGVIADIEWHKKFASTNYDHNDTEFLYANGIMDATGLSDRGKIDELLFVMNGILNIPSQEPTENSSQRQKIMLDAWEKASLFLDDNQDLFRLGSILVTDYFNNGKREFDKEYLMGSL